MMGWLVVPYVWILVDRSEEIEQLSLAATLVR